jgi:hypothetical protein
MDLQYVPAVLTPAKKDKALAMVEVISELARDAGVNVFRRFAFMKGLYQVEQVSFDRMVDPTDNSRLHDSDWATKRVAWAVKLAIEAASKRHGHRWPRTSARACYSYTAARRSNCRMSATLLTAARKRTLPDVQVGSGMAQHEPVARIEALCRNGGPGSARCRHSPPASRRTRAARLDTDDLV